MASHLTIEDVIFDPEDGLVTDEDLTEHLPELGRVFSQEEIISSQLTEVTEENESESPSPLSQPLSTPLSRTLSRTLSKQHSLKENRQTSIEVKSNITKKRKRKREENIYYILSHGQLAFAKHEFKSHCIELNEINHITVPGSILLTHVQRYKNGIKFPLLHHLCDNLETVWHDISEDFILSSSASTNEYDGVYLCIDGVAVRVIPFSNPSVKVRLSTVVSKICQYNQKNFRGEHFNVKVLSCLKEINGNEKDYTVCDQRGLPHENCIFLDLSRECSIKIGGKTKKRRRKHSRKKLVQSYHRRR